MRYCDNTNNVDTDGDDGSIDNEYCTRYIIATEE